MSYRSFVPAPLPPVPPVDLGNEGLELLVKANSQLALLEGLAAAEFLEFAPDCTVTRIGRRRIGDVRGKFVDFGDELFRLLFASREHLAPSGEEFVERGIEFFRKLLFGAPRASGGHEFAAELPGALYGGGGFSGFARKLFGFGNEFALGFGDGFKLRVAFVEPGAAGVEEFVRGGAEGGEERLLLCACSRNRLPGGLKLLECRSRGVPLGRVGERGGFLAKLLLGGGGLFVLLPEMGVIFVDAVLEFAGRLQITRIDFVGFRFRNRAELLPLFPEFLKPSGRFRQLGFRQFHEAVEFVTEILLERKTLPACEIERFIVLRKFCRGLAVGIGTITTQEEGAALFLRAIPFNFYPIFAILMVGLIATGIVKDYGPMKKAEQRAMETGKVLADGAQPLVGKELTNMDAYPGFKPRVVLNFLLPVLMIITIAVGTYAVYHSAKTMEAFLFVVIFMTISMMIQGIPFKEVMDTMMNGIKGALPAVVLLALAYSVNDLSQTMGTANYIISLSEGFLTPHLLPCVIFIVAAIMAFATGSSWGTFAICMPIALPLAFSMTGGVLNNTVVAVFAAVAGGGVFGDHCSPLSDTTILSSMGSASDHLDHVRTQLPYALTCGALAAIVYLIVGFVVA